MERVVNANILWEQKIHLWTGYYTFRAPAALPNVSNRDAAERQTCTKKAGRVRTDFPFWGKPVLGLPFFVSVDIVRTNWFRTLLWQSELMMLRLWWSRFSHSSEQRIHQHLSHAQDGGLVIEDAWTASRNRLIDLHQPIRTYQTHKYFLARIT